MNKTPSPDWDPKSEAVHADQIAAYDEMRQRCPVAHSAYLHWSLFRHDDVMRVLEDHQTFSSHASRHLSVPNGMDPPQHTAYRSIIEPYFSAQRVDAFAPQCRNIAANLVDGLPAAGEVELVTAVAQDFSLQIQSAYLGWPTDLHEPLRQWIRDNQEATLSGSKEAMSAVAYQFDGYITSLLAVRRAAGAAAPDDLTTRLLRERIHGRPLADEEIVSILRNWTVGELGTISACVGILAHYLAARPELQQQLRENKSQLPAAIDEILRIHAPLIANRRVTTKPVEIGGREIAAGERLTIMWASANRDAAVFDQPDEFRLDRDPTKNLLYGAGIHVCPGAPLARMELRVFMEELLDRVNSISLVQAKPPVKAIYPAGGFSALPLWIKKDIRSGSL